MDGVAEDASDEDETEDADDDDNFLINFPLRCNELDTGIRLPVDTWSKNPLTADKNTIFRKQRRNHMHRCTHTQLNMPLRMERVRKTDKEGPRSSVPHTHTHTHTHTTAHSRTQTKPQPKSGFCPPTGPAGDLCVCAMCVTDDCPFCRCKKTKRTHTHTHTHTLIHTVWVSNLSVISVVIGSGCACPLQCVCVVLGS
jgi:hypothetical protein